MPKGERKTLIAVQLPAAAYTALVRVAAERSIADGKPMTVPRMAAELLIETLLNGEYR